MTNADLQQRFCTLWERCSGESAPSTQVWTLLSEHYREPHRFYHNLQHLRHCLSQLDAAREQIAELDATEMAIWFHDVIYEYGARDNEEKSADLFQAMAGDNMSGSFVERVYDFIIATQHRGAAEDEGVAFVVDIDLSGFGLPWKGYLADSDALRKEAPHIGDEEYYRGKLRFFAELQAWPSLFQTDYFRERLEQRARENIQRYSRDLRARGFAH
ncbi:MAG: hypothetical protein AAGA91_09670 [Pseudomonadota bacterium]